MADLNESLTEVQNQITQLQAIVDANHIEAQANHPEITARLAPIMT